MKSLSIWSCYHFNNYILQSLRARRIKRRASFSHYRGSWLFLHLLENSHFMLLNLYLVMEKWNL